MWALTFVLALLVAAAPTATTGAYWSDSAQVQAPPSSVVSIAPALSCVPGVGGARVSWPAATEHTAVTYSAKVVGRNDSLAPVLNDGLYHLTLTSLLGSLIDKTSFKISI